MAKVGKAKPAPVCDKILTETPCRSPVLEPQALQVDTMNMSHTELQSYGIPSWLILYRIAEKKTGKRG